jgi:hypothetical protein
MSRFLLLLAGLLAWTAPLLDARAQDDELTEITESFDGARFSRHWWTIDQRSPPGVKVDLAGDALRFTIPPARPDDLRP